MMEVFGQRRSERLNLSERRIARCQSRAARALLEWSQSELADAANVSRQTVERGARIPYSNNLKENGGGAGVRLRKRGKR
jgi:DNA-binding XRE family transcriptional regulator